MGRVLCLNDLNKYLTMRYTRDPYINESMVTYNVQSYIELRKTPTFTRQLLYLADLKGISDPELYKKAGINRKHFSKIRSNPNYQPKKETAFALCLSLQLNLAEAESLLRSAGYSFSNSHILDLIVQYCIENGIYDLYEVNYALTHYNLTPL